MATLGTTTNPTTTGGGGQGLIVVTPVTATEAGTITSMSMYLDGSGGGGNVKPIIYSDSANAPNTELAIGTITNIASGAAASWVTAAISYTFTNGQKLWIGMVQDSSSVHSYSRTDTVTSYFRVGVLGDYTSPPNPMNSATADSNKSYGFYLTYTPSASAPSNTVAPAVTGTAQVGSTLTTDNGTWSQTGTPAYTYQWQDCATSNGTFANIASATSSTYTIASGEATKYIKCVVTDTDVNGATSASSNVVGPVAAAATSGSASGGVNFPTSLLVNQSI